MRYEGPEYQKSRIEVSPILMTFKCQRSKQHQGGLNRTRQADSPVISEYTNLKKHLVVGREKRSILQESVKGVLHIKSEVKLDTFVNSAFCFTGEISFCDEQLDYLHAVSAVWGSGA